MGRCVCLVAAAFLVAAASADAATPAIVWGAPISIDAHGLVDISCPSEALCVAVDSAGNALTSTDATAS